MPAISDPTAAQAPTSRRVLIVVVTLALSLITAFIAFLVIYDIEPPDASDMAPVPTAKTSESGQINPLEKFLTMLQQHPVDAPPPRKKAPSAPGPSPQETVLNNRALVLKAYEELLQTAPTSWRWPTETGVSLEDSLNGQLRHLMPVANLIRVQAGLAESISPDESIRTNLSLARFAHGLNNSRGLLIHNMVTAAIQRTAILQLERPLVLNAISPITLTSVQRELKALDPSLAAFAETLKAEYLFAAQAYRAAKGGAPLQVDARKLNLRGYPEPVRGMLLKPNLTLATRLDLHRQLIKGLQSSWKSALDAHQISRGNLDKIYQSPVRFWLNPNTTGIAFSVLDAQDLQDSLIRQMGHATIHRQVILQVALRRYEVDHHRLPDDLSELSPAYLSSIPQDPFTDLPMRWNPGTQVLYSVGVNGSDDGGAFRIPVTIDERDIGQFYWWSKAASQARDAQRLAPPEESGRPGIPSAR